MKHYWVNSTIFIVGALACLFLGVCRDYSCAEGKGRGKDNAPMVLIPGGTFIMGSPSESPYFIFPEDETPPHEVRLDAFYMDVYEVTNQQFAAFLNSENESTEERMSWVVTRDDIGIEERLWPTEISREDDLFVAEKGFERFPVLSVSWYGAEAYCRWAGKRLPTEAEWERAARGGIEGALYPWGNALPSEGVIFEKIWKDNSYPAPVREVGNYFPNGFGLFDIAGNVWEWCSDWYDAAYYKSSPREDPKGPLSGTTKVLRGGSWANGFHALRVGFRGNGDPWDLNSGIGFRCVMDANRK